MVDHVDGRSAFCRQELAAFQLLIYERVLLQVVLSGPRIADQEELGGTGPTLGGRGSDLFLVLVLLHVWRGASHCREIAVPALELLVLFLEHALIFEQCADHALLWESPLVG